ncbi:helix-turn-helix transcriptional regulator [Mesorhizobium sp. CU2]|uniref:helix-turn-helix domain-containing protein n=1 Tax=unclassified Mesorhizobium TaxID=325217 RepID=UPI00112D2F37|nr:helix-turn-helix transcriptional regulator [Mesorhizobium sp. CU3]TPO20491.1 helix-turn-helix transcriptional regulator [Mesorhizobium sp. CU2]
MSGNLTPALCRAGRGLLNWTQVRLAAKAGISEGTVRDFESGLRIPSAGKLSLIPRALHAQGVIFIPEGPGVRLKGSDAAIRRRQGRARPMERLLPSRPNVARSTGTIAGLTNRLHGSSASTPLGSPAMKRAADLPRPEDA